MPLLGSAEMQSGHKPLFLSAIFFISHWQNLMGKTVFLIKFFRIDLEFGVDMYI